MRLSPLIFCFAGFAACSTRDSASADASSTVPQTDSTEQSIPSVAPPNDTSSTSWLDLPVHSWNVAGSAIPMAPKTDGDRPYASRCSASVHNPKTAVDSAVVRNGWTIVAPPQSFDSIAVVTGAADADGMCRPWQYQIFVFVNNTFAGTISPNPMDSRTDGAAWDVHRDKTQGDLMASFNRYTSDDPLCCASRESQVSYRIVQRNGNPVVDPIQVTTRPTDQKS